MSLIALLSAIPDVMLRDFSTLRGMLTALEQESLPDLILLDLNLSDSEGLGTLYQCQAAAPAAMVALITGDTSQSVLQEAFGAGISGFMPKSMNPHLIVHAVELMLKGGRYIPHEALLYLRDSSSTSAALTTSTLNEPEAIPNPQVQPNELKHLSVRERQILEAMLVGKSNKEIARDFDMSPGTIKNHVTYILRAMGVTSRARLIAHMSGFDISTQAKKDV